MVSVKNSSVTVNPGLEGIIVGSTAISLVAGEEGRLIYRGYDIADLAANASFEEVAYLLWHGRLPSAGELESTRAAMAGTRELPSPVVDMLHGFAPGSWPMDVLRTAISAIGAHDLPRPDGTHVSDVNTAVRLTSVAATAVAAWDRIRRKLDPIAPRSDLSHAANFLYMKNG